MWVQPVAWPWQTDLFQICSGKSVAGRGLGSEIIWDKTIREQQPSNISQSYCFNISIDKQMSCQCHITPRDELWHSEMFQFSKPRVGGNTFLSPWRNDPLLWKRSHRVQVVSFIYILYSGCSARIFRVAFHVVCSKDSLGFTTFQIKLCARIRTAGEE